MPTGLKRYQTQGHDHLITFSCYHRLPYLNDTHAKVLFEQKLEETRAKYSFEVHAYVVMPEHVHLLLSEPDHLRLATALNVLKTQTSKALKADQRQFWQTRYHDVNILTHRRWLNALRYVHRNPVKRGLVIEPEHWPWSSYRHWLTGEQGTVRVTSRWPIPTRSKSRPPLGSLIRARLSKESRARCAQLQGNPPYWKRSSLNRVVRSPKDRCKCLITEILHTKSLE